MPYEGDSRPLDHDAAVPASAADQFCDAAMAVMRLYRALERVDSGLTPPQYRILRMAAAGGERSARLAQRLAVAKPTLTAIADGLVAAGYAIRQAEEGDRRVVRLSLTDAGRAAVRRADAAYAGWLGQLARRTGDPAAAVQALGALAGAMTGDHDAGPHPRSEGHHDMGGDGNAH